MSSASPLFRRSDPKREADTEASCPANVGLITKLTVAIPSFSSVPSRQVTTPPDS